MLPHVLVHAQPGEALQPGRVIDQRLAVVAGGPHHRDPADAESSRASAATVY
jgi:hypothetical protein